jgi:1,2-diacylglycerol 3-alpha-glucosyltransferase
MRVGMVSKWFNRGQPVVARQLRSALDELGHETFVLARPKKERGPRPGALDRDDVWDQPRVTEASAFDVPLAEYERWVSDNAIEAVLCDQNYQFEELAALRRDGVRVIGRFVWEHFAERHVAGAGEAYDVVYSMTRCEQDRYRQFGMETPYVPWGCHPELIAVAERVERGEGNVVRFVFPGGFLGHRKPLEPVLEAFSQVRDPSVRLLIRAQVERRHVGPAEEAAVRDARIELVVEDQPTAQHLEQLASCDVCLSPARWEGLGLPLYEAIAFGMPAITNDVAPMNEAIRDGVNGLLVTSHPAGEAKSGIPAYSPDVESLALAIERLADPALRAELSEGARRIRDTERSWTRTVEGIGALLVKNGVTA